MAEKLYPLCRAQVDGAIHILSLGQKQLASRNLEARVQPSILLTNIQGLVSGGIVGDYYFEICKCLRANAVQRVAQIIHAVENGQGDRNRATSWRHGTHTITGLGIGTINFPPSSRYARCCCRISSKKFQVSTST